jgi:hypothetical protein
MKKFLNGTCSRIVSNYWELLSDRESIRSYIAIEINETRQMSVVRGFQIQNHGKRLMVQVVDGALLMQFHSAPIIPLHGFSPSVLILGPQDSFGKRAKSHGSSPHVTAPVRDPRKFPASTKAAHDPNP